MVKMIYIYILGSDFFRKCERELPFAHAPPPFDLCHDRSKPLVPFQKEFYKSAPENVIAAPTCPVRVSGPYGVRADEADARGN